MSNIRSGAKIQNSPKHFPSPCSSYFIFWTPYGERQVRDTCSRSFARKVVVVVPKSLGRVLNPADINKRGLSKLPLTLGGLSVFFRKGLNNIANENGLRNCGCPRMKLFAL